MDLISVWMEMDLWLAASGQMNLCSLLIDLSMADSG